MPFIAAWVAKNSSNPWQQKLPIAAGSIQSQVANVTDIFPTLLELVDAANIVPSNYSLDGLSLQNLLTGQPDPKRPEHFLMHYPHAPHRSDYFTSYRNGDWKIIYHYFPTKVSDGSHYQLYNLAADPFESTNLASSKPDRLRSMMQELTTSLEQHNALYPVTTKNGSTPAKPTLP